MPKGAGEKRAARKAKTIVELCDLYLADAVAGRLLTRRKVAKKASTLATDRGRIERHIKPQVGHMAVAAVSTTTAGVAEQNRARDLALSVFAGSIREGEFQRDGASKILYLSSRVTGVGSVPCRLSKEAFERQLRYAEEMTPASPLPLEILVHCWLPRGMAQQWIKEHGYRWPPHLDPEELSAATSAPDRPRERKPVIRRPARQKPFWPDARATALEWLDEYGFPQPGDGGQAKLEKAYRRFS